MPYPFKLPDLPYAANALEPHIDAKTMEIHHDKHHAAYTNKLNEALEKHSELQSKSIDELLRGIDSIPEDIRTAVRNNGGGHANHSLFWTIMGANAGGEPGGALGDAIKQKFGSLELNYDVTPEIGLTSVTGYYKLNVAVDYNCQSTGAGASAPIASA